MLASKFFIVTSKDDPKDAFLKSHKLLLRAGFIKQDSSGVFSYLPLGYKVLKKIEQITREEFERTGYAEILSPFLQSKDLWQTSLRWDRFGPEMFKLQDRASRFFCLPPTAEEAFCDLVKQMNQPKKNYPINLFQIQNKFRDEIRPRFGLIRSREFLMADGYSFSLDSKGLDAIYNDTYDLLDRIFTRLNLTYCTVLADTGVMGGHLTHQFMALADTGESNILTCSCSYAADQETCKYHVLKEEPTNKQLELVETLNITSISDLAKHFNLKESSFLKSVAYYDEVNKRVCFVFIRGDREVNTISVCNHLGIAEHSLRFATSDEILASGSIPGFIGPCNLDALKLIDIEVSYSSSLITGANKKDYHYVNALYERDYTGEVGYFRLAEDGDICSVCKKHKYTLSKGTEVGQVFKLGTKYSKAFDLGFLENNEMKYVEMGSYGVGISRSLQAIVEEHNDDFGIKWPLSVAPFKIVVIPTNYNDPAIKDLTDSIYSNLLKETDVLLDDRDYTPGFKFKDAELIGIPFHIIVGKKASCGIVEVKNRYTMEKKEILSSNIYKYLHDLGTFDV